MRLLLVEGEMQNKMKAAVVEQFGAALALLNRRF
jgi:hypothetical protein